MKWLEKQVFEPAKDGIWYWKLTDTKSLKLYPFRSHKNHKSCKYLKLHKIAYLTSVGSIIFTILTLVFW